MAEPAKKNDYSNENYGIMKDGAADDYEKESRTSALVRQSKAKAQKDLDPKNNAINPDDYRTNRNQPDQSRQAEKESRPNPFQGGSVDQALLQQQQQQGEQAKDQTGESQPASSQDSDATRMNADKKAKREGMAKKAQQMMAPDKIDVFGKSIKMGTNRALQWGWYTLIPSWGLSLLYIDLHVILRFVFGENFFCKLGDEWIPPQAEKAGGEEVKKAGRMIGIIEVIVLLALNLATLLAILAVLGILSIIVQFMTASLWEKAKMIWTFQDAVFGSIKGLYDLFKDLF